MQSQGLAQSDKIAAVVLAGGVNTIPLYEGYQPGLKALIPFAGRPSLARVLDAVRGAGLVDEVCIVGPRDQLGSVAGAECCFAPAGDNLLGSVLAGLQAVRHRDRALIATADMPLLNAAVVANFIKSCAATRTDYESYLLVSVVRDEDFTGEYRKVSKAVSRFRDGVFCHGNLMLATPRLLDNALAMHRLNAMYAARKSALQSALALGFRVGVSYALGVHVLHALAMSQMAAIASRRFGFGIVPVPIPHPQVAIDVDEAADYALVNELLKPR